MIFKERPLIVRQMHIFLIEIKFCLVFLTNFRPVESLSAGLGRNIFHFIFISFHWLFYRQDIIEILLQADGIFDNISAIFHAGVWYGEWTCKVTRG